LPRIRPVSVLAVPVPPLAIDTGKVIVAAPVNDVPLVLVQVIAFEPDVVQSPLSSACESVTVFEELSPRTIPVAAAAGVFQPNEVVMLAGANRSKALLPNDGAEP
jgi:hypothetical protein